MSCTGCEKNAYLAAAFHEALETIGSCLCARAGAGADCVTLGGKLCITCIARQAIAEGDAVAGRTTKPCTMSGGTCPRHSFVHGAEAEELREGLDGLIHDGDDDMYNAREPVVGVSELEKLLERVDARDSLAYLEANK